MSSPTLRELLRPTVFVSSMLWFVLTATIFVYVAVAFFLRLVLNESIVIYGLLLTFLSHSFAPMLPFAAATLLLNLTCLPRIERLLERAGRLAR